MKLLGYSIIALTFLAVFVFTGSSEPEVVFSENLTVDVETAVTSEQKAEGLMFRESLPENQGMLFIFNQEEYRSFWMKDTSIPLDIIFIDSEGFIVNIEEADPEPGVTGYELENYTSEEPVKYVLEVNQGFSEDNGIEEGDQVLIKYLKLFEMFWNHIMA